MSLPVDLWSVEDPGTNHDMLLLDKGIILICTISNTITVHSRICTPHPTSFVLNVSRL